MPLGCCDWLRWFEVPGSLFAFGHHFVRFAILTSVIGAPIASEVGALFDGVGGASRRLAFPVVFRVRVRPSLVGLEPGLAGAEFDFDRDFVGEF